MPGPNDEGVNERGAPEKKITALRVSAPPSFFVSASFSGHCLKTAVASGRRDERDERARHKRARRVRTVQRLFFICRRSTVRTGGRGGDTGQAAQGQGFRRSSLAVLRSCERNACAVPSVRRRYVRTHSYWRGDRTGRRRPRHTVRLMTTVPGA